MTKLTERWSMECSFCSNHYEYEAKWEQQQKHDESKNANDVFRKQSLMFFFLLEQYSSLNSFEYISNRIQFHVHQPTMVKIFRTKQNMIYLNNNI